MHSIETNARLQERAILRELTQSLARATLRAPNLLGVTFDVYRSGVDGAVVVHVDTDEELLPCNLRGPAPLRIIVNDDCDAPIYRNTEPAS